MWCVSETRRQKLKNLLGEDHKLNKYIFDVDTKNENKDQKVNKENKECNIQTALASTKEMLDEQKINKLDKEISNKTITQCINVDDNKSSPVVSISKSAQNNLGSQKNIDKEDTPPKDKDQIKKSFTDLKEANEISKT